MRRLARAAAAALLLLAAACTSTSTGGPRDTGPMGTLPAGTGAVHPTGATGSTGDRTPGEPGTVTRIVDGDTVYVRFRGRELDVRLIGIDTPEVDPSIGVECFGDEASAFTERELDGREVRPGVRRRAARPLRARARVRLARRRSSSTSAWSTRATRS